MESIVQRVQSLQSVFKVRNMKALFVEFLAMYNAWKAFTIADAVLVPTVVAIGTTPENIATTAFTAQVDGASFYKAAVAAGTAFTDADTINTGAAAGTYWGAWILQSTAAGVITTHGVGADQVYATEALAIAALPDADAGNVRIGYLTVNSDTDVDWVAKTDDLTDGSDCTEANFYSDESGIPSATVE